MVQNELRLSKEFEQPDKEISKSNFQEIDESEIWKKFKTGDEAAFIWIYQNYFSKLYGYSLQFDHDKDSVKDHIQDLFIYIRKNRARLADVNSIKFYLFKSIRRRILSNSKKKFSIISIFSGEQRKIFELNVTESTEYNLIDHGIREEVKHKITKSLNKLTPRQREAVQHFYYEGLSYQEIADIMDLKKVKYARKLIYRAIEALRKDLHGLKAIF